MDVVHELEAVQTSTALHVAIGMFDGVHQGHHAVIESARQAARVSGGKTAVLTFHPHPSAYFRPEAPTPQIMSSETKRCVLEEAGVDLLISLRFGPAIATVEADDFLPMLKSRLPTLQSVSVGENFRFGKGRTGDIGTLIAAGRIHNVEIISIPRISIDGEAVSSTRIRKWLPEAPIEAVNRLLGYPYFAIGTVQAGQKLGRQLGFPTLNLPWAPEIGPRYGVYAVRLRAGSPNPSESRHFPAVANYGLRPTVATPTPTPLLEVHILGNPLPPIPSTGDKVRVEFLAFIRPEKKFTDLDSLRQQIARDRETAEAFHREGGRIGTPSSS